MSYFKLFFKILKAHKINAILPIALVIGFSFIMVKTSNNKITDYTPSIYIVNKDNSELSKELVEEIGKYTKVDEYKGKVDIEEELMKSWVSAYVEIPEGFGDSFSEFEKSEGNKFKYNDKIIIKSIENSRARILLDEKINNYLNKKLNNSNVQNDDFIKLEISSAINTDSSDTKISSISFAGYAGIYGIPAIIGTFLILIRNKNLKDRYSCAPVSNRQYLAQITFASIFVTLAFCLILTVFTLNVLFKSQINGIWFLNFLNILTISLFGLGLGLLFGLIVKTINALTGIGTGVSLALAFLGGLFVPIEIFSDTMKKIATFTPTYWYEKANYMLNSGANNIDAKSLLSYFGMQFVFVAAIFIVVAIVNKKKKLS